MQKDIFKCKIDDIYISLIKTSRCRLLNKNKLSLVLIGIAIMIVITSIASSIVDIETPHYSEFYNKKFISAMTNISKIVPQNESIVSSHHYGNMVYFVAHKFLIPYGISTEKSLVSYMVNNNLTYLLVYENFSRVKELTPLFSHDGLKKLDNDFHEIADYTTDHYSRFHLYQLDKYWTQVMIKS